MKALNVKNAWRQTLNEVGVSRPGSPLEVCGGPATRNLASGFTGLLPQQDKGRRAGGMTERSLSLSRSPSL